MRSLTKDVRLGFGSFVDKVLMPYVKTIPDKLTSICLDCEEPYSFKHRLTLTENISVFTQTVNLTRVSGSQDSPEGGFDALVQAIVCDKVCIYTYVYIEMCACVECGCKHTHPHFTVKVLRTQTTIKVLRILATVNVLHPLHTLCYTYFQINNFLHDCFWYTWSWCFAKIEPYL